MIDEMRKTMTTHEVVRKYKRSGYQGMQQLLKDMEHCSKGNRIAIEAVIGMETKQYQCGDFIDITPEEETLKEFL